jgi:hypothetical protein
MWMIRGLIRSESLCHDLRLHPATPDFGAHWYRPVIVLLHNVAKQ